ncbi:MAG: DUF116 domain-containing protein [Candidatus Hydrogenedentes bacterium]|nr:DUF116 domain-containing protein [Candidatus Hydrogenedentota bacterium]
MDDRRTVVKKSRLRSAWWALLRKLARVMGRDPVDVDRWIVKSNNARVRRLCRKRPPKSVLLLLPHCLQWTECPHRIVHHVENCRGCGRCTIKGLLEVADETGCDIRIALSSYTAPQIVAETDPDLIVAVACERELTDGLAAMNGRPAYCIFNERPEGYCRNTTCTVEEVRDAVLDLFGKRKCETGRDKS